MENNIVNNAIYVSFEPFGGVYLVESNDPEILSLVARIFLNFLVKESSVIDSVLEIILKPGKKFYELLLNNKHINSSDGINNIIGTIMEILHNRIKVKNNYWLLHSGGVKGKQGAVLFSATTRSGKSTMVSYLTTQGYGYLSDDSIILDCNTLHITACPYCISLRESVVDQYSFFDDYYSKIFRLYWNDENKWLMEYKAHPAWREENWDLKAIVFLKYTREEEPVFEPVLPAAAVKRLLFNSFSPDNLDQNRLMAARLAKKVQAYNLKYNNFEAAHDILKELL